MNIEVRLFIDFKKYLPAAAKDGKAILSIKEGSTIADLYAVLGLPLNDPKIVVLNGISQGTCTQINSRELNEGDIVAIFPPVGGG